MSFFLPFTELHYRCCKSVIQDAVSTCLEQIEFRKIGFGWHGLEIYIITAITTLLVLPPHLIPPATIPRRSLSSVWRTANRQKYIYAISNYCYNEYILKYSLSELWRWISLTHSYPVQKTCCDLWTNMMSLRHDLLLMLVLVELNSTPPSSSRAVTSSQTCPGGWWVGWAHKQPNW